MMKRNLYEIVSGLAILVFIAAITGFIIFIGIFPGELEEWLSKSGNPRQALIYFSFIFSSASMVLARLSIEVIPFNIVKGENVKRYVNGLPLWVIFFLLAIFIVGFWNVSPSCKAPESIVFEVLGTKETYQPLDRMEVLHNQSITLMAASPDNSRLSCISWEFVGPAFQTLGEKNGCQANITFDGEPGPSFISLLVTQNFCENASLFSLEVKFK